MRKIITTTLLVLLSLTLVACTKFTKDSNSNLANSDFNYGVSRLSVLNTSKVNRTVAIEGDGGLEFYPTPSKNMNNGHELKQAVLDENKAMLDFDSLDEFGNYYKEGNKTNQKLLKHTTADKQYVGEIPKNAQGYEKTLLIKPHQIGNSMTGLYVPAGEVIKVELDKADINLGLRAEIGRKPSRGSGIEIPMDRNFTRMPIISNSLKLDKEVNYIGNPLGGPVYINSNGITRNIKITISGAIEYPHYVLGSTSKVELERLLDEAKGIIFDLEIPGIVRMSMPTTQIEGLSADDIIEAATFWEKAGSLSNYINQGSWYRTHVISQVYDSYIPAGAAVAFVGASFSVMPISWGRGSVDMSMMLNEGSWGNLHEFNHHHQSGLGASGGGEVNNNVVTTLSYLQYTNISSNRNYNKNPLSGWNRYVDPSFALNELNKKTSKNTQLDLHVPLMHSFGVEQFVKAFKLNTTSNTDKVSQDSQYFRNLMDEFGYDMTYYFKELNHFNLTDEDLEYAKSKKYPMYVPVSTMYQVGQKQKIYDKETKKYRNEIIKTAQPYITDIGEEINISESIVMPKGFELKVDSVKNAKNGKVVKVDGDYIYTPTKGNMYDELEVKVTLKNGKITSKQTLILGFGIQNNIASNELTSTIYNNEEGLVTKNNPLDYKDLEQKDAISTNNARVSINGKKDDVMVIKGQIVLPETKDYTFYLTGDDYASLYIGEDRKNLKKVAEVFEYKANFDKNDLGSIVKVAVKENVPLYFEIIVINNSGPMGARLGYDNGNNIVDLPANYLFNFEGTIGYKDYFNALGSYEYRYEPTMNVSQVIEQNNSKVTISDNLKQNKPSEETIHSIVDGNKFKGFHSQVNDSAFPGWFLIEYDEEKIFDSIELAALRNEANPRGLPKDIKISISKDNVDFEEIYNGVTEHKPINIFKFDKNQVAKYLKIEIFSSHRENYIGLGEITISNSIVEGKVINAINNNTYNGNKFNKITDGAYVNGFAIESNNTTLKYEFEGHNIAIFSEYGSKYGTMQVRVNGGKWQEVNLNSEETKYGQLAYLNTNLKKTKNKMEIRSKNKDLINVDFFVIDNEKPVEKNNTWLIVIIVIVSLVAVIGILVFGYLHFKNKQRPIKKKTNKTNSNNTKTNKEQKKQTSKTKTKVSKKTK